MKILVLKSPKTRSAEESAEDLDPTFRLLRRRRAEKQKTGRVFAQKAAGSLLANALFFYVPQTGPKGVLVVTERGMEYKDENGATRRAAPGTILKVQKILAKDDRILPSYDKSRATRSILDNPTNPNAAGNLALGPWDMSVTAELQGFQAFTSRLPGSSTITSGKAQVDLLSDPEKSLNAVLDSLYLLMNIYNGSTGATSVLLPAAEVPPPLDLPKPKKAMDADKNLQKLYPETLFSDSTVAQTALLSDGQLYNYEKNDVQKVSKAESRHHAAAWKNAVKGYEETRRDRLANKRFGKSFADLPQKQKNIVERLAVMKAPPHDDKWEKITEFLNSLTPQKAGKALKDLEKAGYAKPDLRYGLCEHYLYLAKLLSENKSVLDVRMELIKKYGLDDWNFFCRICSARIAVDLHEMSAFDAKPAPREQTDLDKLVFREVQGLVLAHVKFRVPTDPTHMIRAMASTLAPKMDSLETERMKIQANIGDRVTDIITVMTTAYAATMLAIVVHKNSKTGAVVFETDRGELVSKDIKVLLNAAHRITMDSRRSLIAKMHTVDARTVKKYVLSAYRWATSLETIKEGEPEDTREDLVVEIMQSPAYAYLWFVRNLISPTKPGDFEKVIGRTPEEIMKRSHDRKGEIFDKVSAASENKVRELFSGASEKLSKYKTQAYDNFVRGLKEDGEMPPELARMDRAVVASETSSRKRPLSWGPRISSTWPLPKLELSRFYRRDGTRHDWSVWVYEKEKGGIAEAPAREVPYPVKRFVDRKDPVTGEYLSKVKDYDKEILEALRRIEDMQVFFLYFESRCPKGGLHTMQKDVCTKCGYSPSMDAKAHETYYDKYRSVLREEQKKRSEARAQQQVREIAPAEKEEKTSTKDISFKSLIAEASRTLDLPARLLENIGIISTPYEQFCRKGADLAVMVREEDRYSRGRALIFDSYLFEFRSAYGVLRTQNPQLLKTINPLYIPFTKVPTKSWPEISNKNYLARLRWIRTHLSEKDEVIFTMAALLEFLLKLHKSVPRLAKAFAKELERQEIMRTVPEPSNVVPEFQKEAYLTEDEGTELSGAETAEEIQDALTQALEDMDVEEGALEEVNYD